MSTGIGSALLVQHIAGPTVKRSQSILLDGRVINGLQMRSVKHVLMSFSSLLITCRRITAIYEHHSEAER